VIRRAIETSSVSRRDPLHLTLSERERIDRELGDACELMGAEAGIHLTLLARRPLRDTAIAAQAARHRLRKSPRPCAFCG
jgi:DNA-binding transcriptional MocR family regulator